MDDNTTDFKRKGDLQAVLTCWYKWMAQALMVNERNRMPYIERKNPQYKIPVNTSVHSSELWHHTPAVRA